MSILNFGKTPGNLPLNMSDYRTPASLGRVYRNYGHCNGLRDVAHSRMLIHFWSGSMVIVHLWIISSWKLWPKLGNLSL